jgi:hypothetical protein
MQFLPNFIEFACGAPLPFANLLKGLKQRLELLLKVIRCPFVHSACSIREFHATLVCLSATRTNDWQNLRPLLLLPQC